MFEITIMEILSQIEKDIQQIKNLSVLHCSFSGKNSKEVSLTPLKSGEKDCYPVLLAGGTITTAQISDKKMIERIKVLEKYGIPYQLKYEDMLDNNVRLEWCFLVVPHTEKVLSMFDL